MTRILFACLLINLLVSARSAAQEKGSTVAVAPDQLRPGDVIKLWIWQEKDYSGEFLVPENGKVVFPRIGERVVKATTKPVPRDSLISALRFYLNNPSIEITFLKRINILGAVRSPGVFNVDETMNVATALALAGGAQREGKQDQVELYRGDVKLVANIARRTRIAELPLASGDQLYVPERNWVSRNTPIVVALFSGLVSFGLALMAQR